MKTGADPIGWQDIRLVIGEGKLTAEDVYSAVEIILGQRRERPREAANPATNDLTAARVAEIRAGTEGVTSGPWEASQTQDSIKHPVLTAYIATGDGRIVATTHPGAVDGAYASNADHIANCDPQTIAALCDLASEALAAREGAKPVGYVTAEDAKRLHDQEGVDVTIFQDGSTYGCVPLYAAPPAPQVRVKPLVWSVPTNADTLRRAETSIGTYRVWTHHEASGHWFWSLDWVPGNPSCSSEQAAIDAAQANYATRINSAIEVGE